MHAVWFNFIIFVTKLIGVFYSLLLVICWREFNIVLKRTFFPWNERMLFIFTHISIVSFSLDNGSNYNRYKFFDNMTWNKMFCSGIKMTLWLIYFAGFRLEFRRGFGLQTQWLLPTMQKFSRCAESGSDCNPNCQLQEWDWNPSLYLSPSPSPSSVM